MARKETKQIKNWLQSLFPNEVLHVQYYKNNQWDVFSLSVKETNLYQALKLGKFEDGTRFIACVRRINSLFSDEAKERFDI